MSALVTIALITLMLTASTVLITFCIYSQERTNHVWLVQNTERIGLHGQRNLAIDGPHPHSGDLDDQLEQCMLLNANGQFALGLSSITKQNRQDDSPAALLECVADSFFGLGDFDSASKYYRLAHNQVVVPNGRVILRLSLIYSNVLQRPNDTLALIEPLLAAPEAALEGDESEPVAPFNLKADAELNCVYLQALVLNPERSQQVLQYLETLRTGQIPFDDCVLYAQHQVLTSRRYFADAYQAGVEFVRSYPALHQAHTSMGEALLSLQRTAEATSVLKVAHSLVNDKEVRTALASPLTNRNATIDSLLRLGESLYVCEVLSEAERVFALVRSLLQPEELAQQCVLLARVGQLYLKVNNYSKAYVALLECVKHCPAFAEAHLHLGSAQHQLGLLHDATASLKVAARSKALKTEAKAALQAVKFTNAANLAKQAKEDADKLGPQAPLDPNVKRQEPKGLYIDFLAGVQKEREERDQREKADTKDPVTVEGSNLSDATGKTSSTNFTSTATKVSPVVVEVTGGPEAQHEVELIPPAESQSTTVQKVPVAHSTIEVASPAPSSVKDTIALKPQAPPLPVPELSSAEVSARGLANQYIAMAAALLGKSEPNYSDAMNKLKTAIKKAPRYAEPYMVRGDLYLLLGDVYLASADYWKVFTDLDKNNATCAGKLYEIATQLVSTGQIEKGAAMIEQLGPSVPKDEESCMELAQAYLKHKEFKHALLAVFSIDPTLPHSSERVKLTAHIHELSGNPVRAAEALFVGIHSNLTTYIDLGEMYLRSGDKAMAIRALDTALANNAASTDSSVEETAWVHHSLAAAHLALYEEAVIAAQEDAEVAEENKSVDANTDEQKTAESNEGASVVSVPDREHLLKAYSHFSEAQKLGLSNFQTRKFFARYPEFVPQSMSPPVREVEVDSAFTKEEPSVGGENTHNADSVSMSPMAAESVEVVPSEENSRRHGAFSRWFSRRPTETPAEAETTADVHTPLLPAE